MVLLPVHSPLLCMSRDVCYGGCLTGKANNETYKATTSFKIVSLSSKPLPSKLYFLKKTKTFLATSILVQVRSVLNFDSLSCLLPENYYENATVQLLHNYAFKLIWTPMKRFC